MSAEDEGRERLGNALAALHAVLWEEDRPPTVDEMQVIASAAVALRETPRGDGEVVEVEYLCGDRTRSSIAALASHPPRCATHDQPINTITRLAPSAPGSALVDAATGIPIDGGPPISEPCASPGGVEPDDDTRSGMWERIVPTGGVEPTENLAEEADRLADEIDPMWGSLEGEPRPVLNTSGDDDDEL